MELQKRIVARRLAARVGAEVDVLVDGPSPEHEFIVQGRLEGQAPEIDSVCYFTDADPEDLPPGALVRAEVVSARGLRPRGAARSRVARSGSASAMRAPADASAGRSARPADACRRHLAPDATARMWYPLVLPSDTGRLSVGSCAHFFCFWGRASVSAGDELQNIRRLAERVVASHGLELFDLQLRRESIGWVLRVFIDRPAVIGPDGLVQVELPEAGIGVEECETVSRDLGTLLDVEDAVRHEYTLEVSSPGMDRPLRGTPDYLRFAGRMAKIVVSRARRGAIALRGPDCRVGPGPGRAGRGQEGEAVAAGARVARAAGRRVLAARFLADAMPQFTRRP